MGLSPLILPENEERVGEMHCMPDKANTDQDQDNPDPGTSDQAFSESALGCVEVESDDRWSMPNLINHALPKNNVKVSSCKSNLPEVDFDEQGAS